MEPRNIFNALPHEIAGEICDYLPFEDIVSLLLCNRATCNAVTKNNYYWYTRLRDISQYEHKDYHSNGKACPEGNCIYRSTNECKYSPMRQWLITLAQKYKKAIPFKLKCDNPSHRGQIRKPFDDMDYYKDQNYFEKCQWGLFCVNRLSTSEFLNICSKIPEEDSEARQEVERIQNEQKDIALNFYYGFANVGGAFVVK